MKRDLNERSARNFVFTLNHDFIDLKIEENNKRHVSIPESVAKYD